MSNETKIVVEHAVVLFHEDGATTTTTYPAHKLQYAFNHYNSLVADGKKVVMEARRKGEADMEFKC